ncbi:MAG: PorV/PorQ family protein [Bacteroidota bacterium]|nr:PorV/PorQ family protein [Bacteroidota bacterium]MDE2833153.1 PorV/PorQ family protein [Bacteroidota bacterium]MDE2956510.1 PorV/PorQ family protein [Bacteroidota bacterium]
MNKRYVFLTLAILVLPAVAYGQSGLTPDTDVTTQKRAQTGMKFLSTSVDARASALGSALTAEMVGSSSSMFYNPASMAFMPGRFHASAGMLSWIADISYNQASVAFRPGGSTNYGVVGVSFVGVDYGDFIGTVRANNEAGFVETGSYTPSAMAVGLGYARSFGDRFSAGGNLKLVFQNLGDGFATSQNFETGVVATTESYEANTVAYDFGIVYATGFESLVIGMSARNFAQELTYVRERFELPLTFQIGVSMDVVDLTSLDPDMHALQLHVDAQRPRDFSEHLRFGLEYTFMGIVSLRGGFEQAGVSEEQGLSAGAGLQYTFGGFDVGANYTFTDFGVFGSVSRIGIQVGM